MLPIKEIITKLNYEIDEHIEQIKSADKTLIYFNKILGNTSFLLAGLLESLLKVKFNDWDNNSWIDDSLITNIEIKKNNMIIDGVMIWGRDNTTEQWTDPFSFDIELQNNRINFNKFTIRFCDLEKHGISYEKFKNNRKYWDSIDINWKYVIKSDMKET